MFGPLAPLLVLAASAVAGSGLTAVITRGATAQDDQDDSLAVSWRQTSADASAAVSTAADSTRAVTAGEGTVAHTIVGAARGFADAAVVSFRRSYLRAL